MRILASLLLALIVSPAPLLAQQSTVIEEIAARVNNSIITRTDIRRGREHMIDDLRQQSGGQVSDAAVREREKDLLRDLIDQQLLLQKGKEFGITGDVELVKRLDDIRKQMNLSTMEEMEKVAQEQGISFDEFKQNIRNSIVTQQVIGREVGNRIQISNADIEQYYNEHRAELDRPEQVRLSEILIATTTRSGGREVEGGPEVVAAAEAKAKDVLQQLRAGGSFEDLARKVSSGPSAGDGGDLGFFKRGILAKELEDKTFSMKKGEISDVIRTRQGFVILKATEHSAAGLPALDRIRGQIQDRIYMQRVQPALRTYLTKLREESFIDVRQGWVDSGASPNQSNLIYTTGPSTGESAKVKKKKKHLLF